MIKKGQWVEFNMDGLKQGCVIKGGSNLIVAYAHNLKSYKQVKGPAKLFTVIPTPNLDESGIMDAYELKSYKEAGGEETVRFEAKLYKNGKQIAIVSNGGHGGCNDYYPVGSANRKTIDKFHQDATKWSNYYGEEKPFEAENYWIDWVTEAKPTGQSAKTYWELTLLQRKKWEEEYNINK